MRKNKIILVFILLFGMTLTACTLPWENKDNKQDKNESNEVVLESISVKDDNYEFILNSNVDTSLIKVIANYSDGSSEDVSISSKIFVDVTNLGKNEGTAVYKDRACYFNYKVVEPSILDISFGENTKTEFMVGDSFITNDDLDVVVIYSDGSIKKITPSSFIVYKNNKVVKAFNSSGVYRCEVRVSINNKVYTKEIELTVKDDVNKKLLSIELENTSNVIVNKNEVLTLGDVKVKAIYSNGSSEYVTNVNISCDTSNVGNSLATITYQGLSKSYNVTVVANVSTPIPNSYDNLELDTTNAKVTYAKGEELDRSGLKLYGVKGNEKELILEADYKITLMINGETVDGFTINGNYRVIVTYIGNYTVSAIPDLEYDVEYLDEECIPVQFVYSGAENTKSFYKNVKKSGANPADYIVTIDGYAFTGFSKTDWNDIGANQAIVIYVKKENTGSVWVSYLNSDYTNFESKEYNIGDIFTLPNNTPTLSGMVFDSWSKEPCEVSESIYITPIFKDVRVKRAQFGYSGIAADFWYDDIPLENANPLDYIKAPNGYFFMGFSSFRFDDVSNDDTRFVKLYVLEKQEGKAIISFVDHNYNLIKFNEYNIGDDIEYPNPPLRDGYRFISYSYSLAKATEDVLITPIYEKLNN